MNSRQIVLLKELVEEETYITSRQLSEKVAVSERTLQKDLTVIEHFFEDNDLTLQLDRKKGTGILLRGTSAEKEALLVKLSQGNKHLNSSKQLQELIIFHILQNPNDRISLDELAAQLFVNRKLVQEEIKKIKPCFEQYQLELISKPGVGTYILGEEEQKRRLLINNLKKMKQSDQKNPTLKEFFKQDRLKVIQDTLVEVLKDNEITSSVNLANIEIHIYFMLERMKSQKEIELSYSEVEAVDNTKAQQISSQILAKLSVIYPIKFSPSEINYLALRIASTIPSLISDLTFNDQAQLLMEYLINQVADIFSYPLREDIILKDNLLSHLSSTYFRLNYDLSISNPLTEEVFNAYPQLFLVLQLMLDDYFKDKQEFVPQDEIAYLTIHFQSAIERHKYRKSKSFNVLLISEYSKAMASFIEARLNRELPQLKVIDLVEYKNIKHLKKSPLFDFVLSTVPFQHKEISVLEISPMITEKDVHAIEKYLLDYNPSEQAKQFDLASFTQPFLIYPQLNLTEADDILEFMGNNLVANHYVDRQFVSELLSRDKVSSTRVAPLITLPHANPNFVKKSIISIATLKEAVDWHGELISLVILISVTKEDLKNPEFKKLFAVIHYISQSQELLDSLCQTNNVFDILNLLSTYE